MEKNLGIQPELAGEFIAVLLEEDTSGPVATVETETLKPNAIVTSADSNGVITHNPGVCDGSDFPNPIFTRINPAPETHINEEPDD